jgi:hypothetical protein
MENHEGLIVYFIVREKKRSTKGIAEKKKKDIKVFAFFIVCVGAFGFH